jgi:hypothetical protein
VAKPKVVTRVENDLRLGHTHSAIQRLRTYLANHPDDLETRRLLANIYRRTGNLVEAGRWSYLSDDLRVEELVAFERANPSPWLRLRMLRYPGRPEALRPGSRERLNDLIKQAEQIGPPAIWTDPVDEPEQRRSGTLPCLFVLLALAVFVALAAIGVYRAVLWVVHY